jgi:hypothetical protein
MWRDNEVRIAAGRILGVVLCVAGFVVIGLGWNGMARVSCPDCQLPYLLSGGAAGVGLVLLGIGILVVAEIRAAREHLKEQIDRIFDAVGISGVGGGNGYVTDQTAERATTAKPS